MDPVWRGLREEILEIVFSKFSVRGLCRLRTLNKTWKNKLESADSLLGRHLEVTTYPRMFGIVSLMDGGSFSGLVVDAKSSTNQEFSCEETVLPIRFPDNYVTTMGAADGGLVCFVTRHGTRPKFLVVTNPLTGASKRLRLPRFQDNVDPNPMPVMVQLVMNRQTWHYKILVVGYMRRASSSASQPLPFGAHIYNSQTQAWTVEGPEHENLDRVFGYAYESRRNRGTRLHSSTLVRPCVFNFHVNAGLHCFYGRSRSALQCHGAFPIVFAENIAHAVLDKRLFVLRGIYRVRTCGLLASYLLFISEYRLRDDDIVWEYVRWNLNDGFFQEVECTDVGHVGDVFLDACRGFLLLVINERVGIALDLTTRRWATLRGIPRRHRNCSDAGPLDLLCELRWNVAP